MNFSVHRSSVPLSPIVRALAYTKISSKLHEAYEGRWELGLLHALQPLGPCCRSFLFGANLIHHQHFWPWRMSQSYMRSITTWHGANSLIACGSRWSHDGFLAVMRRICHTPSSVFPVTVIALLFGFLTSYSPRPESWPRDVPDVETCGIMRKRGLAHLNVRQPETSHPVKLKQVPQAPTWPTMSIASIDLLFSLSVSGKPHFLMHGSENTPEKTFGAFTGRMSDCSCKTLRRSPCHLDW